MYTLQFLAVAALLAQGYAQEPPTPVIATLTASKSGVLPVPPTGTFGIETLDGAIIYKGPPVPGFVGPGGNATIQANQPPTCYEAVLPDDFNYDNATGSLITGSIRGSGTPSGVLFSVNFTGFPANAEYLPYGYHIHIMAVPEDGNCSATVSHLDPTNRGELYACDVANPQSCQAGDLAGKHGNITGTSYIANYTDQYLSTMPGSEYFFGDKSVVIHTKNTTRLTCANFVQVDCAAGLGNAPNATTTGAPSATPTMFEGAAEKVKPFVVGVLGVVGLMALL